jgi:hypothetical protein
LISCVYFSVQRFITDRVSRCTFEPTNEKRKFCGSHLSIAEYMRTRFDAAFGRAVGIAAAEIEKRSPDELAKLAGSSQTAWAICDKIFALRGDGPFPAALRFSNLSQVDYRDCLDLWATWPSFLGDGFGRHVSPKNEPWRKRFIKRLTTQSAEWKEIMLLGTRKLPAEQRADILFRFDKQDQANLDPLMYLNLCGVPVLDEILFTLQETEVRLRKIKYIAEVMRDSEGPTMRALARLKEKLSKYAQISRYDDDIELNKHVTDFESAIARFQAAAAARIEWTKAAPRTKRRVHTEGEFLYVVNCLVAGCYSNITANDPASGDYWIKSILPAVTCILKAAFPDWFRSNDSERVLRKVKACWPRTLDGRKNQAKTKIYLPDHQVRRSVEFCRTIIKSEPRILNFNPAITASVCANNSEAVFFEPLSKLTG